METYKVRDKVRFKTPYTHGTGHIRQVLSVNRPDVNGMCVVMTCCTWDQNGRALSNHYLSVYRSQLIGLDLSMEEMSNG